MKSLRARLFLHVGSIFLIVAILSYLLPTVFVTREIDHASSYLNSQIDGYQRKIREVSRSWVTYRFLDVAARLNATIQTVEVEKRTIWEIATSILKYDPEIAFVQVTDQNNKFALIKVDGVEMHSPLWAHSSQRQLLIQMYDGKIYEAQLLPSSNHDTFLLFPNENIDKQSLFFIPFLPPSAPEKKVSWSKEIYENLRWKEELAIQKNELIEKLVPYHTNAAGILRVDSEFKTGIVLLSEELFSSKPLIDEHDFSEKKDLRPFVIYRQEDRDVDLAQWLISKDQIEVLVGFSVSKICRDIAKLIQKPILLYNEGKLIQAFANDGQDIPIKTLNLNHEKVIWNGISFHPTAINIGTLSIDLLTPIEEVNRVPHILEQLKNSLLTKVLSTLLVVSLLLFAFALLLLARISRRITEPITLLADASEEIGKGKYEGLHLPSIEKRHDEVAILTHSFEKMVASLRDREKIRGVLNKVVSKEIATSILTSNIELGGEERVLTMLFSDIRGFTPLSEILNPQELIDLLNSYMTKMCRIVDDTHGVVDKFVGDEIMALYGAPLDLKDHADLAIEAAIWMIEDLKIWNREDKVKRPQIHVGIGIHTGLAFAGNMGAENRLNYTVVGANVNLAARLCSAAAPMQILITEETFAAVSNKEKYLFKPLPAISLKGIEQPVPIYAVEKRELA